MNLKKHAPHSVELHRTAVQCVSGNHATSVVLLQPKQRSTILDGSTTWVVLAVVALGGFCAFPKLVSM
jgi:hypothetical protein